MRLLIFTNKLAHLKVTKSINAAMFLKYINISEKLNIVNIFKQSSDTGIFSTMN